MTFLQNNGDLLKTAQQLTSESSLRSLATTMVTAGVTQGLQVGLKLPDCSRDLWVNAQKASIHTVVSTVAQTVINGQSFGDSLVTNLKAGVIDVVGQSLAGQIGDAYTDAENPLSYGEHKGLHFLAGAGVGALQGCLEGSNIGTTALSRGTGAALGHTLAELSEQHFGSVTDGQQDRRLYAGLGQLGAGLSSLALNLDTPATLAGATTAIDYNFIRHPKGFVSLAGYLGFGHIVSDHAEEQLAVLEQIEADAAQAMLNDPRWYVRWFYYAATAINQVEGTGLSDPHRMFVSMKKSSEGMRHVLRHTPLLLWDLALGKSTLPSRLEAYQTYLTNGLSGAMMSGVMYRYIKTGQQLKTEKPSGQYGRTTSLTQVRLFSLGDVTNNNHSTQQSNSFGFQALRGNGSGKIPAQKQSYTLTLEYKEGMNRRDFDRKTKALQDLAERGKLVKTQPVRDPEITKEYRKSILDAAKTKFGQSNPEMLTKIETRLDKVDADHLHELQLGGSDHQGMLTMLEKKVNRSIGSQVRHQMKDLPMGTKIDKIDIKGPQP